MYNFTYSLVDEAIVEGFFMGGGGGVAQDVRIGSLYRWRPRCKEGEAWNRVGIGLSYRHARPHRLAESFPSNRFLGSLKV